MRQVSQLISRVSLTAIAPTMTLALPTMTAMATPPMPLAAEVLPGNTASVLLLDMREETWQQLDRYALFQVLEAQGEVPINNPGALPFLPAELTYETAIAPWIGDTSAIALLPLERSVVKSRAEHEVLIAPIAQPDAFEGFIDTVTDLRGAEPEVKKYQTVSILHWEPVFLEPETAPAIDGAPNQPTLDEPINGIPEKQDDDSPAPNAADKALPDPDPDIIRPTRPLPDVPGLAIAIFPDFIVAAEHPAAIYSWIDLRPRTAADALASDPKFQRVLANPEYDAALVTAHGNLAEMLNYSLGDIAFSDIPWDFPTPFPFPDLFRLQELTNQAPTFVDSSIEVMLYPQPEGIRVRGRGYYDDTILRQAYTDIEPAPAGVLDAVPAATYGLISGPGIADAWEQTTLAVEQISPEATDALDQARFIFQLTTGLDLDREFFGWMDQGFAVFLFPTRQTPLSSLFFIPADIGLGLAIQTSDRDAAEYAFAQLDETLGNSFFEVQPHTIGEQTASSWAIDFYGTGQLTSFLGHGWASDDTVVVTTSIGSLSEILNLSTRQKLSGTSIFRRAIAGFPMANQGYGYLNLSAIRSLVFSLFPADPNDLEFAEIRQILGTMQTVSGTISFSEEYLQLDGLLMLSPAQPEDLLVD